MAKSKEIVDSQNNVERVLVIVESPNKVKTIKQFLPSNYIVMASVGHITRLKDCGDYNMGIDVKNDFVGTYEIPDDKKQIVYKLKEQVKAADKIILMSDPDREGEAIAYHLKEELKIPEKKYFRCTVHEITKTAVLNALNNSRKIDYDLVSAAICREKIDKIIGYRLSGIARNNVGAKSVGRCQSSGLKLIVDKEEEIKNFTSKKYYELFLHFINNKKEYIAKYIGNNNKKISQFDLIDDVDFIINECKDNDYIVSSIESKERKISPKPPFTTSTYQQECASKLGMSIEKSMYCAQKLFEGIDLNGQHQGIITYLRTDSTDMSPEFVEELKNFIITNCGKEYYSPVKKAKKKETDQDGHEAIRPVSLDMTPSRLKSYIKDEDLLAVYTLVYNRTVASSMSSAIVNDTIYTIKNKNNLFQMTLSEMIFNGFKSVYSYKDDDDDVEEKCSLKEKDILNDTNLQVAEKETKPPKRYSEASFIKKLEDLGIGRPSTYATIVKVLLDPSRGYCTLQNKSFNATELGINLCKFLDASFPNTTSSSYTAELEKELDLISQGKLDGSDFLKKFYSDLEDSINKIDSTQNENNKKICPNCGNVMNIKRGKFGLFYGCSQYPNCKTILPYSKKT